MRKPTLGLLLPCVAILAQLAVSPVQATQTYPQLILSDQPVAYYRLEETSGASVAVDSSTNGFNGSYNYDYNNAFPVLGEPGIDTNSIQFHPYSDSNGSEYGYISVPYQAAISPPNGSPFSMEIWVRPGSLPSGPNDYRCPLSDFAGFTAGNNYYGGGWLIYLEPGNEFAWDVPAQFGGAFITTGVNSVSALQWYHLVATYDGTNSTFYVNAVSKGTVNLGTNWTANSGNPLLIGTRDLGDFPWDGNVDEVAIYDYALTSAQISAHYALGTNSFRAQPTPPSISQSPASTTNYSGTQVTFAVTADGTAPLSYQWYQSPSTSISGATSSSYSFVCNYGQNGNSYFVTVSNALGTTNSASATLTVMTNLIIDAQPTSIVREVGSLAAFEVVAEGALPITYQWYEVGTTTNAVPGATNPVLYLNSVQLSANGNNYYAQVSNPFGTIASDLATLDVNPRSVNVPITGYARGVIADNPVAYWRLDETNVGAGGTATDAVGSFDGTYNNTSTTADFTFGVPTGIPHESDPAVDIESNAYVSIPYAIELNPQGPFTAEGWFKPSTIGSDYRTVISSFVNPGFAGPTGWLIYQQPSTTFALVPYSGFYGQDFITDTTDIIVPNTWYHLVVTYDGGTLFKLYVNGHLGASDNFPGYVANGNVPPGGVGTYSWNYTGSGSGATMFGWRSDQDFSTFSGSVDEVAFYNHALTSQQIEQHYLNQVMLTYTLSGKNIILSWPFGTLESASAAGGPYSIVTGATSPYTNAPVVPTFYRVKTQ